MTKVWTECGCELRFPARFCVLHASAPDLLAALETVVDHIGWLADANAPNTNLGKSVCPAVNAARAAIARARGR